MNIAGLVVGEVWIDATGYLAAGLVFLTFCMKTLLPLRLIAIASNIAFIVYALGAGLTPVLVLHGALLPLNVLRCLEQVRARRKVLASSNGNQHVETLVPLMRGRRHAAGDVLFLKGDKASDIYYVASGAIDIPEVGKTLGPGSLFGEIGPFTPDRIRSASAVCAEDCELLVITDRDILRHCMNDPAFGMFLTRLIVSRLTEDETSRLPAVALA